MHLKQRHPHLQVVLSVGGSTASEVFPVVASSTLLRDNFARSALGLVEASGLDGIDSKYERTRGRRTKKEVEEAWMPSSRTRARTYTRHKQESSANYSSP